MPGYTDVDLRAGARLDRFTVEVFARNLFNKRGITNAIGFDGTTFPNGAAGVAIIRPRTIGLTITAGSARNTKGAILVLNPKQEVEPGEDPLSLTLPQPYLLFLGDTVEAGYAKTAFGLRDWARDRCVGEFALPSATVSVGLPKLRPIQAREKGARSLIIGVANSGGFIADSWVPALVEALEAGLHIISGMHERLGDLPELRAAADRLGRRLIDVRDPPSKIPIATGLKRRGKRLLTVGTDCALGKKYTALSIAGHCNSVALTRTSVPPAKRES